jgi:hypothetical protein
MQGDQSGLGELRGFPLQESRLPPTISGSHSNQILCPAII